MIEESFIHLRVAPPSHNYEIIPLNEIRKGSSMEVITDDRSRHGLERLLLWKVKRPLSWDRCSYSISIFKERTSNWRMSIDVHSADVSQILCLLRMHLH
jgi:hypothetical protein